ncbi:PAS domain-containing protein [Vibrio sp. JC009]|uniref:PAS domain-containing protein n=1 Tax=Vibrio sp. JC009 TaxID=2912314 RepID=UPI0023B0FEB6|nr:PAS domain-containing protein [Vibrio sp. JC009]WED22181.1 PAS domain-containing protein [Vibrio sp. JC009]
MGTEKEVSFGNDEFIVTKTDTKGMITYANRTFMRVANYSELQLIGRNHNIIRHPDMPRGVFYGLWKSIKSKQEFFGFVKNYTSEHNYYWVFANVTPDLVNGSIVGFYSVRRSAPRGALEVIEPVYRQMLQQERSMEKNRAPEASWSWLQNSILESHQTCYEEFILSLYHEHYKGG